MFTSSRKRNNCRLKGRAAKLRPLLVVDLFSGAGLFGYAFQRAGFCVSQAVECDRVAAATHASNLPTIVQVGDIRRLDPRGKCDVLIAGPPCQGFSTLGRQDQNDPRNALSLQVVRWAKILAPRVIIVENVAAFLDSPQWATLYRRLEQLGYGVKPYVLNAVDFGVAQLRLRSFTIASRLAFPEIQPPKRSSVTTVRECISDLPVKPNGLNHHFAPTPSSIALSRMKLIPPGGDKRDIMRRARRMTPPSWWKISSEATDVWGRMEWDKPCNTLRTAFLNASKGRYIHPDQNRVISLREGARLHSIPDEWRFCGTPYQIARQIGNSVPPLLGRAIANGVKDLF